MSPGQYVPQEVRAVCPPGQYVFRAVCPSTSKIATTKIPRNLFKENVKEDILRVPKVYSEDEDEEVDDDEEVGGDADTDADESCC